MTHLPIGGQAPSRPIDQQHAPAPTGQAVSGFPPRQPVTPPAVEHGSSGDESPDQRQPIPRVTRFDLPKPELTAYPWYTQLRLKLHVRFGFSFLRRLTTREREAAADNRLWELRYVQKVLGIISSNGGVGKTTISAWLNVLAATSFKQPTTALDYNQASGNTAERMGIAKRSELPEGSDPRQGAIELPEYLATCEELTSLETYAAATDRHPSGASVVGSDLDFNYNTHPVTVEAAKRGIAVAKLSNVIVICDLGNPLFDGTAQAAVDMADTLVFCGRPAMPQSMASTYHDRRRYRAYGLTDKVNKAPVAVIDASEEEVKKLALALEVPVSQIHCIPADAAMASAPPVDLSALKRRTRVALKELLIAILAADAANDPVDETGAPLGASTASSLQITEGTMS